MTHSRLFDNVYPVDLGLEPQQGQGHNPLAAWEAVEVAADGLVLTRRVSERGVHETAQRAGAGPATDVVRAYVGYEEWPENDFLRREMARHGIALILGFGDAINVYDAEVDSPVRRLEAFVVGHQGGTSLTGIGGHQLGVQVELTPQGARALFGDVESLTDAVIPLGDLLGVEAESLLCRLAERASWTERLDVLDGELGRLCDDSFGNGTGRTVPSPEVEWVRCQLHATHGAARVEPLLDETGWSRRHVTDRFRRQIGVSPKAYARHLRFEHASSLLSELPQTPGRTIAAVAMEAGYYDQSHLTRDFTALGGVTPAAFVAQMELVPEVRFVQDLEPGGGAQ